MGSAGEQDNENEALKETPVLPSKVDTYRKGSDETSQCALEGLSQQAVMET
jgi:hypothetical protein